MYVCTYVLCNSAVFTKMPRLSDQGGGGAILLKGASVHVLGLSPHIRAQKINGAGTLCKQQEVVASYYDQL